MTCRIRIAPLTHYDVTVIGRRVLFEACAQGDIQAASIALLGDSAHTLDVQALCEGLIIAAHHGHASCAALVLDRGATANLPSHADASSSPLHMAAQGGHAEVAQLLLGAGGRVDAKKELAGKLGLPDEEASTAAEQQQKRLEKPKKNARSTTAGALLRIDPSDPSRPQPPSDDDRAGNFVSEHGRSLTAGGGSAADRRRRARARRAAQCHQRVRRPSTPCRDRPGPCPCPSPGRSGGGAHP